MNRIYSDCDYCSIIKASAKPKPNHSDDNLFSDRTVVLYSSAKYDDEASFIVTFYVTPTANDDCDLLPHVVDDDPF